MARGDPAAPASASRRCDPQGNSVDSRLGVREPAKTVAELRQKNQRRSRLTRNLARVYRLGRRPISELVIELAERLDALPLLEELAQRFADRLDPDLLRALGGHEFPPGPIRIIAGARR
jgi:hypothetical protein